MSINALIAHDLARGIANRSGGVKAGDEGAVAEPADFAAFHPADVYLVPNDGAQRLIGNTSETFAPTIPFWNRNRECAPAPG